jgi:uncharacterized protein (TIGR00369 family)
MTFSDTDDALGAQPDGGRPDAERWRRVTWSDPIQSASLAVGLDGLAIMRAIRDGRLPGPPMARLVGFECVLAEEGEIVMRLEHDPSLENAIGLIHGGAIASMLDTAMGAAANTRLPAGASVVTLDLTITYLRPVSSRNTPVTATGRLAHMGGRNAYVLGELHDATGELCAHAVGNFSIVRARA